MAYINILEQPQVNEVDSLLGIKDDKVVQIDSKDSCLSGLNNLTEVQKQQVRENINALEDEAGVIDAEHIATGAVTRDKLTDGTVTTQKIANEAVTDVKLAPLSVGESRIKGLAVTTPKIANKAVTTEKIAEKAVTVSRIVDGAVTTPKIADGAVTNDKIGYGAVTNNKICPEAITIDKLELDLEAMVSDNVKYRKQNLTIEQKAQARKNIDVDYLTEDEVANLWDTTD